MDRETLMQYRDLGREIRQKSDMLKKLEGPGREAYEAQAITLRQEIVRLKEKQRKIERFIGQIPNSRMRQIFAARYEMGMSWQRISFAVGAGDESTVRKQHDRYLERKMRKKRGRKRNGSTKIG